METNEKYKTNKKVAIRFLKELGLLEAWKEFLKSDFKNSSSAKQKNLNNWYEEECIDKIFGKTNFTGFLEEKKDYYPGGVVVALFRAYITQMDVTSSRVLTSIKYEHIVNGNK